MLTLLSGNALTPVHVGCYLLICPLLKITMPDLSFVIDQERRPSLCSFSATLSYPVSEHHSPQSSY